jgi:hypothetical protein
MATHPKTATVHVVSPPAAEAQDHDFALISRQEGIDLEVAKL